MKITERDLENLRIVSDGGHIAYVDRLRLRFRGDKPFLKKGRHYPLPVTHRAESILRSRGWSALYSPALWAREFPSMSAILLNTAWGLGLDAASSAAERLSSFFDTKRPASYMGMVESIFSGPQKRPHAIVKTPMRSGGYSLHEFALVAPPELTECLGRSVEFFPPTKSRRARISPISPPTAVGNGRIRHLSAWELVSVLEAHAEGMDFAGSWERKPLPSVFFGKECMPPALAGLYAHQETGEAVLVLRGTRPLSLKDWLVNIRTTHGSETSHHRQALATTLAASKIAPRLFVAGHSKGGGLAQYVSAQTGIPSVTFNTVGLPCSLAEPATLPLPSIEHFMVKFDPVSNLGGVLDKGATGIVGPLASARGLDQRLIGCPRMRHVLPPPANRGQVFSLHSLRSLKEVLKENPMVIPSPTSAIREPSFRVKGVMRCPNTGEILYEIDPSLIHESGSSTRNTFHQTMPLRSRKRTSPSSISASTVSRFR